MLENLMPITSTKMVLFEITYFIRNTYISSDTPEISCENIETKQYIIAT